MKKITKTKSVVVTCCVMIYAIVIYTAVSIQNMSAIAQSTSNEIPVYLLAKLTPAGRPVREGMVWRIFSTYFDDTGKLILFDEHKGGNAVFKLQPGTYYVHAGFGLAEVIRKIEVEDEPIHEQFFMNAGGIILSAQAGDKKIPPEDLSFDIFEGNQDKQGNRKIVAENIKPDHVIRLKRGVYHVASEYGKINASIRTDIEVEAGKTISAVLKHRAAKISLRLVSQKGGAAIANTAWTVLTDEGEKVFVSDNVAPKLVLSEGKYEASVRNGDNTYIHDFNVEAGQNKTIEVLLN